MKNGKIRLLATEDSGATLIEYALIAAFVATAAVVGLIASGETLSVIFDGVAGNMADAAASRR